MSNRVYHIISKCSMRVKQIMLNAEKHGTLSHMLQIRLEYLPIYEWLKSYGRYDVGKIFQSHSADIR